MKKVFYISFFILFSFVANVMLSSKLKADESYLYTDLNGIKYQLTSNSGINSGEITGYNGSLEELIIPNEIEYNSETYEITTIGSLAFFGKTSLKKIIMPDSIVTINSEAFYGCSEIVEITISKNIKKIERDAFFNCDSLVNVYYNGTLEKWCEIDFKNSSANPMYHGQHFYLYNEQVEYEELVKIELPSSIEILKQYTFFGFENVNELVFSDKITEIGIGTFSKCSSLLEVNISKSVTSIGFNAFNGCDSLSIITLPFTGNSINNKDNAHFGYIFGANTYSENGNFVPTSLKIVILNNCLEIDSYAFYNCSKLIKVVIPEGVTSIGEKAFSGCSSLTSIIIPDSVIKIGASALYGCSSLESITLPFIGRYKNVTSDTYFGYIFGANSYSSNNKYVPSSLKEVIITGGESIGDSAFYNCNNITNITFSDSVTSIESNAFEKCTNLINIYYNGTIEDWCNISFASKLSNPMAYASHFYMIGENEEYFKLTEIEIPTSVLDIKEYTFYSFKTITSVNLHGNLKTIGKYAFSGCILLENIIIPNSVTIINEFAFEKCAKLITITLSGSLRNIYNCAFSNCSSLVNIYYNGTIEAWCYITFSDLYANPMYYGQNIYMLDEYNEYYEVNDIVIPNNIQTIKMYTFVRFNMSQLFIGDSVSEIEKDALYDCSNIKSITVSASLTILAASYNVHVDSIYYRGTMENYCNITFSESSLLSLGEKFYMLDLANEYYEVTEIVVPETITTIKAGAFSNCKNIKNIILPETLEVIGQGAFEECDGISEIIIPDKVTKIDRYTFFGCDNLKKITLGKGVKKVLAGAIDSNVDIYYRGTVTEWCDVLVSSSGSIYPTKAFNKLYILNESNEFVELTEFVIENTATSITTGCFLGIDTITKIYIPNSIKQIGTMAFFDCNNLKEIYYEGTINEWLEIDFGINSLVTSNVEHFYLLNAEGEYWEPTEIEISIIEIPDSEYRFELFTKLTKVTLLEGTISIGNYAFSGCTSLKEIIISNTVQSIGDSAFSDCSNLETIVIPDSIESIGDLAFSGCINLNSIKIGDGVTTINNSAFKNCISLEEVIMPKEIETIGSKIFNDCTNLKKVIIQGSPISVAADAFNNCENCVFYICTESFDLNLLPDTSIYVEEEYCDNYKSKYSSKTISSIDMKIKINEIDNYVKEAEINVESNGQIESILLNNELIENGTIVGETYQDGTYVVYATNIYGYEASCSFILDNKKPIIMYTVNDESDILYNNSYIYTFKTIFEIDENNLSKVLLDNEEYDKDKVLSLGEHTIVAIDLSGNKTEVYFTIANNNLEIEIIDLGAGSYSNIYNSVIVNVTSNVELKQLTLNGEDFTNGSKVLLEGYYVVIAVDKYGLTKQCKFIIDKTSPKVSGYTEGQKYSDIALTIIEDYLYSIKINGEEISLMSVITLNEHGTYVIEIMDMAFNKTELLVEIDRVSPEMNYTIDDKGNIIINGYSEECSIDIEKDGKKIVSDNDILRENGSYVITIKDSAGNINVYNLVIDKKINYVSMIITIISLVAFGSIIMLIKKKI